jgi:hypothetical protein
MLVMSLPVSSIPVSAAGDEYSLTVPADTTVIMGDASATIPVTVHNSANSQRSISRVTLYFDQNIYHVSASTGAPTGWSIHATPTEPYAIDLRTSNTADEVSPGNSLTFDVTVTGVDGGFIPGAATDVIDALIDAWIKGPTGPPFNRTGGLPDWDRKGLKVSFFTDPNDSVAVNGAITVSMRVNNRSTADQDNIVPGGLTISGTGAVSPISGPTPSSLSLSAGGEDVFAWTYTASSSSTITFSGSAANSAVSSLTAISNELVIGDFSATMSTTPLQVITGQYITVKMIVYNNGDTSLGNVVPSALTTSGASIFEYQSGPDPTSIASIPSGSSATFQWTYKITGSVGDDYAFSGYATANGPVSTNTATTGTGYLMTYSVGVSPGSASAGATDVTFIFTIGNQGANPVKEIEITSGHTNFNYSSASVSYGTTTWTVSTAGSPTAVTFTAASPSDYLQLGDLADFSITYSTVPSTTSGTDYLFPVAIKDSGSPSLTTTIDTTISILVYAISLAAVPSSGIDADGSSTSAISATLKQAGTGIPDATLYFHASRGILSASSAVTNGSGEATVTLTAPYSTSDVQTVVEAIYLLATGYVAISFTGVSAELPNLLYIGGTLSPTSAHAGAPVSFSLNVTNAASVAMNLTTGSYFRFTDGTYTYQAFLSDEVTVGGGESETLTFSTTQVPSGFQAGSYKPILHLTDGLIWQYRDVSDMVQMTAPSIGFTNHPTNYTFGLVEESGIYESGLTHFTITNTGDQVIAITIHGTDMIGGSTTWTLSDTATPGTDTFGLKAGLEGGAYNVTVRKTATFNTLKSSVASGATQKWGLQMLAPTSFSDSMQKTGTVILTANAA